MFLTDYCCIGQDSSQRLLIKPINYKIKKLGKWSKEISSDETIDSRIQSFLLHKNSEFKNSRDKLWRLFKIDFSLESKLRMNVLLLNEQNKPNKIQFDWNEKNYEFDGWPRRYQRLFRFRPNRPKRICHEVVSWSVVEESLERRRANATSARWPTSIPKCVHYCHAGSVLEPLRRIRRSARTDQPTALAAYHLLALVVWLCRLTNRIPSQEQIINFSLAITFMLSTWVIINIRFREILRNPTIV